MNSKMEDSLRTPILSDSKKHQTAIRIASMLRDPTRLKRNRHLHSLEIEPYTMKKKREENTEIATGTSMAPPEIKRQKLDGGKYRKVRAYRTKKRRSCQVHNTGRPAMPERGSCKKAMPYVIHAVISLLVYMVIGGLCYYSMVKTEGLKGVKKFSLTDALYFLVVTMSSTGYGDISALLTSSYDKIVICALMLLGCGFVAVRMSALFNFFGNAIGDWLFGYLEQRRGYPISESSRVKYRVGSAILTVFCCIGLGLFGGMLEDLAWLDSLYLSVATVLSVGYGDISFMSPVGRLFAVFWIPVSTSTVNLALGYLFS